MNCIRRRCWWRRCDRRGSLLSFTALLLFLSPFSSSGGCVARRGMDAFEIRVTVRSQADEECVLAIDNQRNGRGGGGRRKRAIGIHPTFPHLKANRRTGPTDRSTNGQDRRHCLGVKQLRWSVGLGRPLRLTSILQPKYRRVAAALGLGSFGRSLQSHFGAGRDSGERARERGTASPIMLNTILNKGESLPVVRPVDLTASAAGA